MNNLYSYLVKEILLNMAFYHCLVSIKGEINLIKISLYFVLKYLIIKYENLLVGFVSKYSLMFSDKICLFNLITFFFF